MQEPLREQWIIPTMLGIISFLGGWGIKLIVERLTLIAEKLTDLYLLFTGHDKDIGHLRISVDKLAKEQEYTNDRLRDLEAHLPRESHLHKR